jgi:hypothetical protein
MGFKTIELKLRTDYSPEELQNTIKKVLKLQNFTYQIEKQSLDGRNPEDIHWVVRVGVVSPEIFNDLEPQEAKLQIRKKKTDKHVVIVGSGPAGFFAAIVAQEAGFKVTIVEQGTEVNQRTKDIKDFEKTGDLNERSNYSYGEGGAGTFSDGKLTSRTKSIMTEKKYIFDKYVEYGAPDEIHYLAKPHVGSNQLIKIVKSMRQDFLNKGGVILFDNKMIDFKIKGTKVVSIETEAGVIKGDYFIFAIGHSSYDSYKLMMKKGIKFQLKNFAVGTRVEHPQELINMAKWRVPELPGVKAADYSLTYNFNNALSVYTFCMCPGGMVVPASPQKGLNIVNGMSNYKRNYPFANSAIVAGVNIPDLLGRELEPIEALDWLISLERKFYDYSDSYKAPAVKVSDFLNNKTTAKFGTTSYPFDLLTADFRELFPFGIIESIDSALRDFVKKINGFEEGVLMGLESRTSSPIQLIRDGMRCAGLDNLYLGGEGSGLAGGIVSSAADGIKCAMDIINRDN